MIRGYTLIIAEKPKAAKKIAEAFGSYKQINYRGVKYWQLTYNNENIIIVSAAGHLFGITGPNVFPVYTMEWKPLWEIDKKNLYTKKYINTISYFSKNAEKYINACDYDIEGSVIGFILIEKFGDLKKAKRMKISALTKEEILRSYSSLSELDINMVNAGIARHKVDWLWGINVSRALMISTRSASGKKVILSAGRVQSPSLIQIVNREIERSLYFPYPEFRIKILINLDNKDFYVFLNKKFESIYDAKELVSKLKNDKLIVTSVSSFKTKLSRPSPFNLMDLQLEAGKFFGYSPYKVERLAEELYLEGLISYPRTNSQRIPSTVNLVEIVNGIAKGPFRSILSILNNLTSGKYIVRQGEKDDPAHPAIYPTGYFRKISKDAYKIYELIVRRFLASISKDAIIQKQNIILKFVKNNVDVSLNLQNILYKGWITIYPYNIKEDELINIKENAEVDVKKITLELSLSKPLPRYNRTSLLKWMESVKIGTEATRGKIIETLFSRKYVEPKGKFIVPTKLGITIAEVLNDYFSELTSIKMTSEMESKLNDIIYGKIKCDDVVNEIKEKIGKYMEEYNKNKEKIGNKISKGLGYLSYNKCKFCDFEEEKDGLCKYHLIALERLKSGLSEWEEKTGYNRKAIVSKLSKSKSTGKLILDLINNNYIMM
uniref:DNA topoisomerase n=1 Tax=Acidianus brierleyi TaxID=41673 RepID=A0A2U9IFY5_9CREN